MYTINIGLANPFTKGYNTVDDTITKALQFIEGIVDLKVSTSGDEPTVIIQYTHHKGSIAVLATALDQDCIALYDHQLLRGELIGAKAEAWGEFNPEYFQTCFA
jgi:hypothetical protein